MLFRSVIDDKTSTVESTVEGDPMELVALVHHAQPHLLLSDIDIIRTLHGFS